MDPKNIKIKSIKESEKIEKPNVQTYFSKFRLPEMPSVKSLAIAFSKFLKLYGESL